jgi:hypothetical protein
MSTKRVPVSRPAVQMITARAVELFRELERANRARKRAVDCTISEQGLCTADCRACRRWWDAHDELHTALDLPPWRWPAIPRNPYPPGSPKARDWRPDAEQAALWDLLNKARLEAAKARRPSSKISKADERKTDVESVAGQEPRI